MPKVLLLTRYDRIGASSRVRILQFLPLLARRGFEFDIKPLLDRDYLTALYNNHPISWSPIFMSYMRRLRALQEQERYDLIWLEKEAFPWVPASFELMMFSKVPYVVDIDDAWHVRYQQHSSSVVRHLLADKISRVIRNSAVALVGNECLARFARDCGARRVHTIPSVIDLDRYRNVSSEPKPQGEPVVIGWIGAPPTLQYLLGITPALRKVLAERRAVLHIIGAAVPDEFRGLPVVSIPWSEATEVDEIRRFDIGIMPLFDGEWERGKCGYKLLQVMAAGKPVVASPVGANSKIVQPDVNGAWAVSTADWVSALERLVDDPVLRQSMGEAARQAVQKDYSLRNHFPRLASALIEAIGMRTTERRVAHCQVERSS